MFDLGRGGFSHLELTDRHGAEALDRGTPQPGEIRIGDRNYARAPVLRRFRAQSGNTADLIVRLGWNALQLTNPAGRPFALIDYLQCLPPDRNPHEVNLRASVGRNEPALAVRLIVQRKTPEAAEATRGHVSRAPEHDDGHRQAGAPSQRGGLGLRDRGLPDLFDSQTSGRERSQQLCFGTGSVNSSAPIRPLQHHHLPHAHRDYLAVEDLGDGIWSGGCQVDVGLPPCDDQRRSR